MINSSKLIPRRSSGNSLNLTATSNLNVVRGTVVKIDNILKERLVLSKVREGIIRQQEERRIRSRRETLLERDDVKNNYSVDDEVDVLETGFKFSLLLFFSFFGFKPPTKSIKTLRKLSKNLF